MLTNFPNGITSYGMPVLGGGVPFSFGTVYFVDYSLGSDSNDGKSPTSAFKTLTKAYNTSTTNMDDEIIIRGYSTVIDDPIAWTKSRIHVIGSDGTPGRIVQQGAKVQSATAGATSYVIKDTGTRNSFVNIKFIQASTAATALTCFESGGEGTYFQNSSFIFGVVDNLGDTDAHEFLAGTDSGNFINCTFGSDVLLTSAARSVFHIDQVTSGQEFKSNVLVGCKFLISSSSSTACFVRLEAVGDVLFTNLFEDCTFIASIDSAGGAAIAEAAKTGTSTVKGGLYFVRPNVFNVTDFAVATGGRNTNIQVVAPVAVAAAIEGIKPTA